MTIATASHCHINDCHHIKPPREVRCHLEINGMSFKFDGKAFQMQQFAVGATNGFEGAWEKGYLTVFFKGEKLFLILLSDYRTHDDYIQYECR